MASVLFVCLLAFNSQCFQCIAKLDNPFLRIISAKLKMQFISQEFQGWIQDFTSLTNFYMMQLLQVLELHLDKQGLRASLSVHHSNTVWKSNTEGRSQDGGGIGWGDYFLFYKFIERTTERWTKFTKQLLIASIGHQAPRKAAHCLRREVGQKY